MTTILIDNTKYNELFRTTVFSAKNVLSDLFSFSFSLLIFSHKSCCYWTITSYRDSALVYAGTRSRPTRRYLYQDTICRRGLAAYQTRDLAIRSALIVLSQLSRYLPSTQSAKQHILETNICASWIIKFRLLQSFAARWVSRFLQQKLHMWHTYERSK